MFQDFIKATNIDEALAAMSQTKTPFRIIAGGTDLLLQAQRGKYNEPVSLISIADVGELAGIQATSGELIIGAATKLADIERSNLLLDGLEILKQGVKEVGSPQIRHLATIGGNICNASPSADTIPALLVLEASVLIQSLQGKRSVPLCEFFLGPGKTCLKSNELMVSIIIPSLPPYSYGRYIKLKSREAQDLAIASVAALLMKKDGKLIPRIALGAVAPTPLRARSAEAVLMNATAFDEKSIFQAALQASLEASPITDIRASAEYRTDMVRTLTGRAIQQAMAEGEQ